MCHLQSVSFRDHHFIVTTKNSREVKRPMLEEQFEEVMSYTVLDLGFCLNIVGRGGSKLCSP